MSIRLAATFPDGTAIPDCDDIPFISLDLALVESGVGALQVEVIDSFVPSSLTKDCRFLVFRTPYGGSERLIGDAAWIIMGRETNEDEETSNVVTYNAYHANVLLRRRVVASGSGSAGSTKVGPADDVMKEFVAESYVTASDSARNVAAYMAVESDSSQAPTIAVNFEWKQLAAVLAEIRDATRASGSYIGFELSLVGNGFRFRTFTSQRGVDRRISTGNWLPLGREYQNVSNVKIRESWESAATVVYELGPGEGDIRPVVEVQRFVDELGSPFGRIETMSSGNARTEDELGYAALSTLEEARHRIEIDAEIIDTTTCIYGIDYDWGDRVTLETAQGLYDCFVDPVRISASGSQVETVTAQLTYRG